jgi:eukaryotic-like serine/threonine-protein kinase
MEDTPLIGRTLAGRFQITGIIGEGGMATVYRGVQEGEPRSVAVKVMSPELARDKRFVRRFRREAKAASMLKHPNIVEILEFGVDGDVVYLAMECVEGYDLSLALHRERRLTEARAARIMIRVCEGLGAAHDLHIVHRDLKPDNVMIAAGADPGDDERVKVLDFGIAKILDDSDDGPALDPRAEPPSSARSMLTRVGTIVGTPAYMSPEQGRAEAVDARTDLYSCGVVLYELLTGKTPFDGETPMQVVMRHVNEPPKPPSSIVAVHPGLEAIIMKALAKFPAERQQNAGELAAELEALLPDLATARRSPGSAPLSPVRAPRPAAGAPVHPSPPSVSPSSVSPASGPPSEPPTIIRSPKVAAAQPPAPARSNSLPSKTIAMNVEPPLATKAPAFPTLNINLPDDFDADEEPSGERSPPPKTENGAAKEASPSSDVATTQPKPPVAPPEPLDAAPATPEAEPLPPPVDDEDDEDRTLVANPSPAADELGDTLLSPFASKAPAPASPPRSTAAIRDLSATIPLLESEPPADPKPPRPAPAIAPAPAPSPPAPAIPLAPAAVVAPAPKIALKIELAVDPVVAPRADALPAPPPLWKPSALKRRPMWVAPAAIALGVLIGAAVFAVLMGAIVLLSR